MKCTFRARSIPSHEPGIRMSVKIIARRRVSSTFRAASAFSASTLKTVVLKHIGSEQAQERSVFTYEDRWLRAHKKANQQTRLHVPAATRTPQPSPSGDRSTFIGSSERPTLRGADERRRPRALIRNDFPQCAVTQGCGFSRALAGEGDNLSREKLFFASLVHPAKALGRRLRALLTSPGCRAAQNHCPLEMERLS